MDIPNASSIAVITAKKPAMCPSLGVVARLRISAAAIVVARRADLAAKIDPRSPYRPCEATARRAQLAGGTLPPQPRAPQCDPRQLEAGAKAFAPYRLHVCCFARRHQQLCSEAAGLSDRLCRVDYFRLARLGAVRM